MDSNEDTRGYDKHADKRDAKRDKRIKGRLLRGNRMLFEIQREMGKRAKRMKGDK